VQHDRFFSRCITSFSLLFVPHFEDTAHGMHGALQGGLATEASILVVAMLWATKTLKKIMMMN
jgi:hypothetical protein